MVVQPIKEITSYNEWNQMRDNVRRVVLSLEVCWNCQRVSQCQKQVLGGTVMVWFCKECSIEREKSMPAPLRRRVHPPAGKIEL